MKKTLVTIAVAALTVSSFAQGTLNIVNNVTGLFRAQIYAPQAGDITQQMSGNSTAGIPAGSTVYTGVLLQGTGFTFAVYYGAATVVDPNLLTLLATSTFRTGSAAGLINSLNGFVVPGIAPGEQAKLQVRVWDVSTGSDYASAFTHGQSPMFTSGALGGVGAGGPVLTPDMTGWTSFNIYTVPEPSTFVLAGLGAASLLIFRRRK